MAYGYRSYNNGAYCDHEMSEDTDDTTTPDISSLFQCPNETVIDEDLYRKFSALYTPIDVRSHDPPVGGSVRLSRNKAQDVTATASRRNTPTPNTTPTKTGPKKERSGSVTSRKGSTTTIYEQFGAVQKKKDTLSRSRSTVYYRGNEDLNKISDAEPTFVARNVSMNRSASQFSFGPEFTGRHATKSPPNCTYIPMQKLDQQPRNEETVRLMNRRESITIRPEKTNTYVDVNFHGDAQRYCNMGETSIMPMPTCRVVHSNRNGTTNLAIIPPNHRVQNRTETALAGSPVKSQTPQQVSPAKASWLHLPSQPVATESLWLCGVMLLITGIACCVLCFYIFSKKGRTYYIDLGLMSGFITLVLGFLGVRSSSLEWLPNRNYISGYIILSALNLIQFLVLGLMAINWYPSGSPEADIATGAICGLSFLTLFLAVLGLCLSTCCKNPPPDNRVAHCAVGFTV